MATDRPTSWWRLLGLAVALPAIAWCWAAKNESFVEQFGMVASAGKTFDENSAQAGLGRDYVFIASVVCLIPFVHLAKWSCIVAHFRRDRSPVRHAEVLILAAASLDVVENLILGSARTDWPLPALLALTTVGWVKLLAYIAAVVAVVMTLLGPSVGALVAGVAERVLGVFDRASRTPEKDHPSVHVADSSPDPTSTVGICVSGGGIRAAAVALGALRRFDAPVLGGRSLFARTRWLCSVSGGGYVAAGWRISRQTRHTSNPPVSRTRDGLFDERSRWFEHARAKQRYLANGGVVSGVAQFAIRIAAVLAALAGVAVLVGFALGKWVHSDLTVKLSPSTVEPLTLKMFDSYLAARLWAPGVAVLVLAGLLGLFARRSASKVAAAAGVTLLALLVALPLIVGLGPSMINGVVYAVVRSKDVKNSSTGLGSVLSVLSGLGLVGALGGLIAKRLQKQLLRLGGIALGLGLGVIVVVVARTIAADENADDTDLPFGVTCHVPTLVVASAAQLLLVRVIAAHRLTLAGLYRKRIAATFVTKTRCGKRGARPIPYSEERAWTGLVDASGPELIVAATVQSSKNTVSGLKGMGMTFTPHRFTLWDGAVGGVGVDPRNYPTGSWWRGYPRTWSASRAMAISGAAVASAMGRIALGTTNALLVAFNVRLGMWLPNPRRLDDFDSARTGFFAPYDRPQVGLAYLAKELFGRYDPGRDPFVYVTDGGHRENLGLVEMLRHQPDKIFAVDASGDEPGTFQTLKEAIDLAQLELGVTIEPTWGPIVTAAPVPGAPEPSMPAAGATTARIVYADGRKAALYYGRFQVSRTSPADIRAFAATNPKFPNYSTFDQFLTEPEFSMLIALGHHIAGEMMALPGAADVSR